MLVGGADKSGGRDAGRHSAARCQTQPDSAAAGFAGRRSKGHADEHTRRNGDGRVIAYAGAANSSGVFDGYACPGLYPCPRDGDDTARFTYSRPRAGAISH